MSDLIDDGRSFCFACEEAFVDGDPVYFSDDGLMHASCCGPERDAFHGEDEAPLSEGEPIPRPSIWTADDKAMSIADDETNDTLCVNRFAIAMQAKLRVSREKGRHGWDDPAECSLSTLSDMLIGHVAKGDPVDVANFAMMLHQRGGRISNELSLMDNNEIDRLRLELLTVKTEAAGYLKAVGKLQDELAQARAGTPPPPARGTVSEEMAGAIVEKIFEDLRDRRFLKWLFDRHGDANLIGRFDNGEELRGLDLEVQDDIKSAWNAIIRKEVAHHG